MLLWANAIKLQLGTLGYAFCKPTTVLNKVFYAPEDLLSTLRQNLMCSGCLVCCGLALRPKQFMTAAPIDHRTQRSSVGRAMVGERGLVYVKCGILLRGIQDCTEAVSGTVLFSSGFSVRL